jgi:Na+/glutamate symporter
MNDHDKDPFEKYDKLFDDHDEKSIVQPSTEKKAPSYDDLKDRQEQSGRNSNNAKAARIIMTVFFVVIAIQVLPVLLHFSGSELTFFPIFSFILIIVVIKIIIKAFKR